MLFKPLLTETSAFSANLWQSGSGSEFALLDVGSSAGDLHSQGLSQFVRRSVRFVLASRHIFL
jgi:hypothetical protein